MLQLNIRHRINLLYNTRRRSHGHRKVGYRPGDDAARRNGASLANRHTGHDCRIPTNPAIIANDNRFGILDAVAAGLHARLVGGGVDGHGGSKHDTVADLHKGTVENDEAAFDES